ncbi:hypothetical protein RORB6_21975 [Raoultella ornithinolytica B6]|nr:hypothetical protein RORB6_21975 [Raoultella ornithinolytica B6]
MRSNLNRPVAMILNDNAAGGAANVQSYLSGLHLIFTWDHRETSDNRVVDGDQLRAIREGGLDLDVGDHFGYALHDLFAA